MVCYQLLTNSHEVTIIDEQTHSFVWIHAVFKFVVHIFFGLYRFSSNSYAFKATYTSQTDKQSTNNLQTSTAVNQN